MSIGNRPFLSNLILKNPLSRAVLRRLLTLVDTALEIDSKNLERCLQRNALQESAEFVQTNLRAARSYPDAQSLLTDCLRLANPENGDLVCEFGVHTGGSINLIASQCGCTVHGFDSFEGLPERWRDQFEKGRFAVTELPKVRKNVHLIKGWFDATLPGFLKQHPGNVSFLHVDCDLYSSTSTVLRLLKHRISKGTVIVFDEFFNYPNWQEGEFKAFSEFISHSKCSYEYVAYCRSGEQVAVAITSPPTVKD
jgi:hypothetical protein